MSIVVLFDLGRRRIVVNDFPPASNISAVSVDEISVVAFLIGPAALEGAVTATCSAVAPAEAADFWCPVVLGSSVAVL